MAYNAKVYKKQGGDELVIAAGGKLTVEEGAVVDGIGGGDGGPVAWGDVTGKPSTFPPTIGTGASQAAAGNHTHPDYEATLADLESRVAALESAA